SWQPTNGGGMVILPPLPAPPLTAAVIWLSRSSTNDPPVSVISPPPAVAASVVTAPLRLRKRFPVWITILPASPWPVLRAEIVPPLLRSSWSVAAIVTVPPCPLPRVLLLIWAPPVSVNCPTRTSRLPASPLPLVPLHTP